MHTVMRNYGVFWFHIWGMAIALTPTLLQIYSWFLIKTKHFPRNMFPCQSLKKCRKFFLDFHIFINTVKTKRQNLVITRSYFVCRDTVKSWFFISSTISLRLLFLPFNNFYRFIFAGGTQICYTSTLGSL